MKFSTTEVAPSPVRFDTDPSRRHYLPSQHVRSSHARTLCAHAAPTAGDQSSSRRWPRPCSLSVTPHWHRWQLAASTRQPPAPVRPACGCLVRRPVLLLAGVADSDQGLGRDQRAAAPCHFFPAQREATRASQRGHRVAQPATSAGASGCGVSAAFTASQPAAGDTARADCSHSAAWMSHLRGGKPPGVQQPRGEVVHNYRRPPKAWPLCTLAHSSMRCACLAPLTLLLLPFRPLPLR